MDYGEFLRGLEPSLLGLVSSTFAIDHKTYWDQSKSIRRVLSSKYTLADISDDYFDVEASFVLAVQWANADGPVVQPLRIECVFWGHFHTSGAVNKEHAKTFAETESWLIFWPFFRQFVSDTTSRMAIPPIMIPMALGPGEHSRNRPATVATKSRSPKARKRVSRKHGKA